MRKAFEPLREAGLDPGREPGLEPEAAPLEAAGRFLPMLAMLSPPPPPPPPMTRPLTSYLPTWLIEFRESDRGRPSRVASAEESKAK